MKQAIRRQPIEITAKPPQKAKRIFRNIMFGGVVFIALLMMISFLTYHPEDSAWSKTVASTQTHNWLGVRGAYFSDVLFTTIGRATWLVPLLLLAYAYRLICQQGYRGLDIETIMIRIAGIILFLLAAASLFDIYGTSSNIIERGGAIGQFISTLLTHSVGWLENLFPDSLVSNTVSKIILFFFLFLTSIMASGSGPVTWIDTIGALIIGAIKYITSHFREPKESTEAGLTNIEHLMEKEIKPQDHTTADQKKQPNFLIQLLKPKTKESSENTAHIDQPIQSDSEPEPAFVAQKPAPTVETPIAMKAEPTFAPITPQTEPKKVEPSFSIPTAPASTITPKFEPQMDEFGHPKLPTIFKRPTNKIEPQSSEDQQEDARIQNLTEWVTNSSAETASTTTQQASFAADSIPAGQSIFAQTEPTFNQNSPSLSKVTPDNQEQDFEAFLESLEKFHPPTYDKEPPVDAPTLTAIEPEPEPSMEMLIESSPVATIAEPEIDLPTLEIIPEEISLPEVSEILDSPHKIEPTLTMETTWEPFEPSHEPFNEIEEAEEVVEIAEPVAIEQPIKIKPPAPVEPPANIVMPPVQINHAEKEARQAELLKHFPMAGQLPPLNLLGDPPPSRNQYDEAELLEMAQLIEEQLRNFSIKVKVANIEPGPVVTRFELELAPGVKVAQINNLEKDIARGLSVTSVRVVDIIPGTSFVGLEIPNRKREIVYFKSGLESKEYQEATDPLTLILGKSISGETVTANLAKMPHVLVAGTTGSGKSVGVNTMLLSMLFKARPEELRLILIDPKMLELSVYNDIPHLLIPVITDMKESANALRWCVAEMERRYLLMSQLKVRNIAGFNQKVQEAIDAGQPLIDPLWRRSEHVSDTQNPPLLEKLPFIVVVIDEFADMMMLVGKKCEELIARLAQKARASGIHLILATQRPSVDVITGLIKANIPTRIAFQVSSKIDSRTIIDQQGAETLLGHGDMLYAPSGVNVPIRVHGSFVDDHEVNKVAEFLKLTGEPDYIEDILQEPTEAIPGLSPEASGVAATPSDEQDPLFDEAVKVVVESRRASISFIQRKLRVGYQRAARLMEEMEELRIVTPPQSNGNREVLMAAENEDY